MEDSRLARHSNITVKYNTIYTYSVAVLGGSQGGPWPPPPPPPQIFITQKNCLYVLTIRKVFISTCISENRGENEETIKAT